MYTQPKTIRKFDGKLYLKVFLLALIVSLTFFSPFLLGDRGLFLFYGDYNVQQIPFYQLAHRAIREGNIGFNFYTDLGVNFIGSYSFYLLGSPFFWLTIPFPNEAVPYLMAPLFCLKFAVAAVTAAAFIRRFVSNKNYAIIGGLLYAFSGFGIYNIFFNHFHEVVAFFPLLLLSLEMFVEDGRRGPFAAAVFITAFCNYFFFFGEVVFTVIYFFIRLSSSPKWRIKFKEFLLLFLEAVIGLLLAGALLVPSLVTVLGNPRVDELLSGWHLLVYSSSQRYFAILQCLFFPPDIPARPNFFPDANAKWSSLGAWLPLVSMTGVITFIQTHKGHFIKRMLGISLVMALIPGLNSLYVALNDAYYARWFFMPILLMALATVISLERCTQKELNSGIRWSLIFTVAFCAVGLIPNTNDDGEFELGLIPYPERFWAYVIIAVVCILIMVLVVNVWRKKKYFTKLLTILICVTTVIYSFAFISMGKAHSYNEDFIIDNAIYGSEKITLERPDDEFYRIDVYDGMDNLPMFWKFASIQAFHSVVPASVMSFYPEIDVERGVASRPEPSEYALRTLTSCKYLFIESGREDAEVCYGFEKIDTQNGFDVYENRYYVPMGWTYDNYFTEDYYDYIANYYRTRHMLKGIYLSEEQVKKYDLDLNELQKGDDFLNQDNMYRDVEVLRNNCADSFTVTNTGFESTITLDKPNLVFFSVPYDEGWSATVNGKEVEVERVNSGFVAVFAENGDNQITFTYTTPGLKLGLITTGGAIILFAGYLICIYFYRKKHPFALEPEEDVFDELSAFLNESASDVMSFKIKGLDEVCEKPENIEPLKFEPESESNECPNDNTEEK